MKLSLNVHPSIMFRLFFLLFIFFGLTSVKSQTHFVSVIDGETGHPLVKASITSLKGAFITATNKMGMAAIPSPSSIVVRITHIGYDTAFASSDSLGKTTEAPVNIYLYPKATQLKTAEISDIRKARVYHGSELYNIYDFAFNQDDLILITFKRSVKRDPQLRVIKKEKEISIQSIPPNPSGIHQSYRGENYLLYDKSIYKIQDSYNLKQIEMSFYYDRIAPIIDSISNHLLYDDYRWYFPAFNYYSYHSYSEKNEHISQIINEQLMELYRSSYKYMTLREKLNAAREEERTGIDRENIAALNSGFHQSLYYEPLFAPLFIRNDTINIFNHYNDSLYKYNEYGKSYEAVPINYHHNKPRSPKFKNQILQDELSEELYVIKEMNGFTYAFPFDTSTGKLASGIKLKHPYIEKLMIRNDQAFYLYRGFGSLQEVYLYSENLY